MQIFSYIRFSSGKLLIAEKNQKKSESIQFKSILTWYWTSKVAMGNTIRKKRINVSLAISWGIAAWPKMPKKKNAEIIAVQFYHMKLTSMVLSLVRCVA